MRRLCSSSASSMRASFSSVTTSAESLRLDPRQPAVVRLLEGLEGAGELVEGAGGVGGGVGGFGLGGNAHDRSVLSLCTVCEGLLGICFVAPSSTKRFGGRATSSWNRTGLRAGMGALRGLFGGANMKLFGILPSRLRSRAFSSFPPDSRSGAASRPGRRTPSSRNRRLRSRPSLRSRPRRPPSQRRRRSRRLRHRRRRSPPSRLRGPRPPIPTPPARCRRSSTARRKRSRRLSPRTRRASPGRRARRARRRRGCPLPPRRARRRASREPIQFRLAEGRN